MTTIRFLASFALVFLLTLSAAQSEEVKAGELVISNGWSRATPGGAKIGSGYLTIVNKGTTGDKLLSGVSAVSGKVELHEMTMNKGVMTMRPLAEGLPVGPGQTVQLAPGGLHLMLTDLKAPLKQGDKVPLTLQFEKAGAVNVTLDVQGVGAKGPGMNEKAPMMDHKGHSGMKM